MRHRVICLIAAAAAVCRASPPVKVSLRTSWPSVPLLLEALETINVEEPESFFPLLDALSNAESLPLEKLTSEAVHQLTIQTALSLGYLQEPGALASVELQLSLHAAAPKIQAFYQFYEDQYLERVDEECGSWVDWYGERICDIEKLAAISGHETIDDLPLNYTHSLTPRPKHMPFDHISPSPSKVIEPPPHTAIFYASPTSKNFKDMHTYLYKASTASPSRLEYIFRHIPPHSGLPVGSKSYLSGYGVTLDLKKTDYLAVDDRRTNSDGQVSETTESNDSEGDEDFVFSFLSTYTENSTAELNSPLTSDELLTIDYQATQFITSSPNPLLILTQLSQNFPRYSTSVARRVPLNQSVVDEIQRNNLKVHAGASQVWLNGFALQDTDVNPYGLLRLLRKERTTVLSLTSLGLSPSQALDLLTHRAIGISQADSGVLDGLCDASDRAEGGSVIVWWNDMTKDSRYARWNPSLSGLLRPVYPGQFHNIKQNLFNVVIVADLSQTTALHFMTTTMNTIIHRGFPFRFGVVPIVETEAGKKMARVFYHSIETYGRAKTMALLSRVSQLIMPSEYFVDMSVVRSELQALQHQDSPEGGESEVDVHSLLNLEEEVAVDERINKAKDYALRLDSTLVSSLTGHVFVNGKHFNLDDDFLKHMQTEINQQLQHLIEKVFSNEVSDDIGEAVSTYFYDLPDTEKRRSQYVYPAPGTGTLRIFNLPEAFSKAGLAMESSAYLYPESGQLPLSTYVIADLDSDEGIALVKEALTSLHGSSPSRLAFIHNVASKPDSASGAGHLRFSPILVSLASEGLLSKLSASEIMDFLQQGHFVHGDASDQIVMETDSPAIRLLRSAGLNPNTVAESDTYKRFCHASALLVRDLGVSPGERMVIVNGRMVGPIVGNTFLVDDFKALQKFELRRRVTPVIDALTNITVTSEEFDRITYSNIVSSASSVISSVRLPDPSEQGLFNTAQRPRHRNYRLLEGNYSFFDFGDKETALYNFGVLIDPLSDEAPRMATILEWFATVPSVYVEVYLNPIARQELPLKRFYRYNLSPTLAFNDDGSEIEAQIVFDDLPEEPIYTLGMDVHPSWLVRPREALYDLDNIQLSTLSNGERTTGLEAVFELDYIVIEGHARDTVTTAAPRGLQLQLNTIDNQVVDDTLVAANLGYFQFKAKPGVFKLEIREGRGRDVFKMESVGNEGWDSPDIDVVGQDITLTSFEGVTLYPRFRRQPGMQRADVLDEFVLGETEKKGFLSDLTSRVSSFFMPNKSDSNELVKKQADVNIFTVASGLLYERFASIMILSVLRNTQSTVKFWFIENFLSPSFLEFLPHFAEAYGFEYELITYKWPSWLRAQTEKQRVIWAYKILFLDVLFPMDLKKVIFVDADQIVRADLLELVNLDLQGAPYGYTPMGNDNEEMEGFRFWKTGYWKDFLRDRPYHISALYVVDLVRFRQMAAGDILRAQYQTLSQDPNSLANLDQDLPNNLQREVPIFSLDEDWLWCETWCSKDRLHRAKTIDLCQNPLTKEPKLSRARQIPEWETYDAEIARFARKLADEGKLRSHVATADANVLANANADPNANVNAESSAESGASSQSAEGEDEGSGEALGNTESRVPEVTSNRHEHIEL